MPERVLGIGKAIRTGGFQIVLLSVELYRSGLAANFRLVGERPMFPMLPGLSLEIADDIGTEYLGQQRSGSGTGLMWQTAFEFVPAMPPDAKELQITVREITVMGPGMGTPAPLEKGPWVFDVDMKATV